MSHDPSNTHQNQHKFLTGLQKLVSWCHVPTLLILSKSNGRHFCLDKLLHDIKKENWDKRQFELPVSVWTYPVQWVWPIKQDRTRAIFLHFRSLHELLALNKGCYDVLFRTDSNILSYQGRKPCCVSLHYESRQIRRSLLYPVLSSGLGFSPFVDRVMTFSMHSSEQLLFTPSNRRPLNIHQTTNEKNCTISYHTLPHCNLMTLPALWQTLAVVFFLSPPTVL